MDYGLKVLRVKKFPLYDVFQGEGWENWSRVLVKGTDSPRAILVSGSNLAASTLKVVLAIIKAQQQPK